MSSDILELVAKWPEDLREEFEERAAIIEFDAKIIRPNAEGMAYRQILKEHRELRP